MMTRRTARTTMGVVTVQKALEISSDVGAAKMALKLGPDKFYQYIRGVWVWRPVGD